MSAEDTEDGLRMSERLRLLWWKALAWLHRCPECGHRPDGHKDWMPRWEDDRTARLLGIGQYGCRRCGHGAIEEARR